MVIPRIPGTVSLLRASAPLREPVPDFNRMVTAQGEVRFESEYRHSG